MARTVSSASSRLNRQFGWILASRVIGMACQVIQLGIFARLAGPSDFATGVAVVGALQAASAVLDLGLGTYLTKERSGLRRAAYERRARRLVNQTAAALAVAGGAVILVLPVHQAWALAGLAVWAATEKVNEGVIAVAISDHSAKVAAVSVLVRRGGALLLQVFIVLANGSPLAAFSLSQVFASALAVVLLAPGRWWQAEGGVAPRREVLRLAWPFYMNTAFTQIRNLDVSVVHAIAGGVTAGLYAVPARLTSPLRMLTTSMAQATLPATVGLRSEKLRELRGSLLATLAVSAVLLLTMTALAGGIPLVLGSDYQPSVALVRILCVGLIFASANSIMSSLLQAQGRELFVGRVAIATTIFTLATIALAAEALGAIGATVALAVGYVLQFALLLPSTVALFRKAQA